MDHNSSPLGGGGAAQSDKPRLTEQEKKNNHIASEQKRRQAIREGFDEIAELVPGMAGHGRSEALVLESASAFLKQLLADRWRLLLQARDQNLDTRRYEMDHDTMRMAEEAYLEEQSVYEHDMHRPRKLK